MEKNDSQEKSATKTLSKMKLNLMGSLKNVSKKESIAPSDGSEVSHPTPSTIVGKKTLLAARKGITAAEKDLKKKNTSLSSFKVRTGFLGGKKKKSGNTNDSDKEKHKEIKEIKRRLFFQKKSEYSDEEILRNLGTDNPQKVVGQSMEEIANAATFMKKFLRLKDLTRSNLRWPSPVYVGSIKGCDAQILRTTAVSTTIFLGKIISKKDKYGLYRGSESGASSTESFKNKDNPLLVALEKIKSKHQSVDSTDSRPASPKTNKLNAAPNVAFEETVDSLLSGLLQVKLGNIKDWNIHKNVTSDTELKTISILF